jgi:hypothetical protein
MADGSTVLLTVHGIGFQQPPQGARAGYADLLHEHLRAQPSLAGLLGEDPERPDGGPVYVSSEWQGSREEGLARLRKPLVGDAARRIAHVALVYSPSEPLVPRPGAVADTLARAVLAHSHYNSALGTLRMVLRDAWAALHEKPTAEAPSTLRPRTDTQLHSHRRLIAGILRHEGPAGSAEAAADPTALGILRALEDDVATYVTRNELRERVRGFVQSAMLALLDREDVEGVVVNAHSQGTVLCWDVLCRLPLHSWVASGDPRAGKLRHLVTAGSPIRKYVDLFAWGELVGELAALLRPGQERLRWTNFWDELDPVADPLNPPAAWRPGQPTDMERPPEDVGLLAGRGPEDRAAWHATVEDRLVDNLQESSGGGLQAHDYWNNENEFVARLAEILSE